MPHLVILAGREYFSPGGESYCETGQSVAVQSAVAAALMPLLIFCCAHRSRSSELRMLFSWLDNPKMAFIAACL